MRENIKEQKCLEKREAIVTQHCTRIKKDIYVKIDHPFEFFDSFVNDDKLSYLQDGYYRVTWCQKDGIETDVDKMKENENENKLLVCLETLNEMIEKGIIDIGTCLDRPADDEYALLRGDSNGTWLFCGMGNKNNLKRHLKDVTILEKTKGDIKNEIR